MLSKIVVLLFVAHVISAFHLSGPNEQLRIIITELNQDLPVEIHEASISIRANTVPLKFYTDNARQNVISGLTEDAQTYWTKIAELQEQAKKVDKSSCVDSGMKLFYELNNTAIAEPNRIINSYLNEGNLIVSRSYDKIHAVNRDLENLTTRANDCEEDACAANLLTEAILFSSTARKTIRAAVAEITQYAQVEMVKKLAAVHIDEASYVSEYNNILTQVETCIGK